MSLKALALLSLLAVGLLLCQANGSAHPQTAGQKEVRQAALLTTIADRHVSEEKLMQAVTQLTMPPTEPPQYWSRIANNVHYPRLQRREVAYQLFKRQVRVGMQLSELNSLLQHPTWLRASDISLAEEDVGKMPVHWAMNDTVLVIRILPDPDKDVVAVYLEVARKPADLLHFNAELQRFQDLLLKSQAKSPETSLQNTKIVEIGLSPLRPR